MDIEKETILHNRLPMPTIGYRVSTVSKHVYKDVLTALEAGYRLFDIPADSTIEKQFGKALQDSKISRNDVFLILKISNQDHTYDKATHGFHNSLSRCQTDYVDLLMIDWPNPKDYRDSYESSSIETWKAVEDAYKKGSARAIGVANYESRHIEYLLGNCEISPMANEARIYPGFPFTDNLNCANEHKIFTLGYLPDVFDPIVHSKEITIFAEKYHVTNEQICIRYLFEKGCAALISGDDAEGLASNFNAYNFSLSKDDMAYLDVMHNYGQENINPDEADF